MTIRYRVLLIVGLALAGLLPLQYFGLRLAFVRSLTAREVAEVTQQTSQAKSALEDEGTNLSAVVADYAAWDKTYALIVRPDPEFAESDLADEALRRLRLDAVLIVDSAGRLVLERVLPHHPSIGRDLEPHLARGSLLTRFTSSDDSHAGLIDGPEGPILVAARPVVRSDGSGALRGTILMARRMDDAEITRIGHVLRQPVILERDSAAMPHAGVSVTPFSRDRIDGAVAMLDVYGRPTWRLRLEMPRPLQREGERLLHYFFASLVAAVVIVATVTLLLLDGMVLKQLSRVSRAVGVIGRSGSPCARVPEEGTGELAKLGAAINGMLDSIAAGQQAVEDERAGVARAAVEAARLKSAFIANMSHEIRTPMNGVMGVLGLLRATPVTDEQRRLIDTAHASADGLLTILNDVLDFSKIEAGKLSVTEEPVELRRLVEDVVDVFGPAAGAKNIDLLCRVSPTTPGLIETDPTRLRQVLLNLVGNAVKFTDRGHVLLDVELRPSAGGLSALEFRVEDTGIGIAGDQITQVFDPFVQADAAASRRHSGTGLGLAITRRLVELMGGTVHAQSQPGVGSTFTVTLTLPIAVMTHPRPAAPLLRAFLVDTYGTRRSVYADALRACGCEVIECLRPSEALAASRASGGGVLVLVEEALGQDVDGELARIGREFGPGRRILVTRLRLCAKRPADVVVLNGPSRLAHWRAALGLEAAARPPEEAEVPHLDGRVLVVEDNAINRMVAVSVLARTGCVVDTAEDGRQAVARACSMPYDLILMDCQMPEMDGYEASRQIRARGLTGVPIVALTSHAFAEDRQRCLDAGMDEHLAKPFRVETMYDVLRKHLVERAGPPVTTPAPAAPPAADVAAPPEKAIDTDTLRQRLASDDELIAELAGMLIEDADRLARECATALEAGDANTAYRAAHTLKGAAGNLCATPLADAAATVERFARAGDCRAASESLDAMTRQISRVRPALLALSSAAHVRGKIAS